MTHRNYTEIPPSATRNELHDYARQEFERHREVTDLVGPCVHQDPGVG